MKQIIKAPLSQVIWARIYILTSLISALLLSIWVVAYFFVLDRGEMLIGIIAIILCAMLLASGIFVSVSFWAHAWSKIVIENGKISVTCPFISEISLNVSDIRKLAVRKEGKASFVLITNEKRLPYKEMEKIQSENGLIKFFLTEDYKNVLSELLPMQLTKPLRKM